MNALDRIVRGTVWQILVGIRDNSWARLRELRYWERQSHAANKKYQWDRLKALLRHADEYVPYYRSAFATARINSHEGVTYEEFLSLPLLSKDIIRARFEELKSTDLSARKWWLNSSGGSTGEPIQLVQDSSYHDFMAAVKLLFDAWTGYKTGERRALLWGSERDLLIGRERLKHRISRWLRNECWLNAYRMPPDRLIDYVNAINRFQPTQILAYVESIWELSLFIERNQIDVHSPRAVMTSAGTLHDDMRADIERVFRAPVYNRYGSREVGDVACECERREGLHICIPTHFVEVLRPDGTPAELGEVGEVVITHLTNYAMPLIRYRIGDMAAWSETSCSCGRGWPVLKTVVGRVTDQFRTRDGRVVDGRAISGLIRRLPFIRRYQVVQETFESMRLLIEPVVGVDVDSDYVKNGMAQVVHAVRNIMGREVQVQLKIVDEILPTKSGKYRYLISNVDDSSTKSTEISVGRPL